MKPGPKSGSGFRTLFWGPLVLAHFPQAPKTGPIFGPAFWEPEYRHDLHLELAFGTMKIWTRIKKAVPDAVRKTYMIYVASSHIRSTAAKKAGWFQLAACTHVRTGSCTLQQLWRPFVQGHIFYGFFGLVNEPAKPSKTVATPSRRFQTGVALCSYVIAEIMWAQ